MNKQNSHFAAPFDYLDIAERNILTLSLINKLVHHAQSTSPFYKNRLPEHPLQSLSEITRIPILRQ
jgi:hypothetical protein